MSIRTCAPLCLAVAVAACASTPKNYLEPGTPLYEGSYGTPPPPPARIKVVTFNVELGLRPQEALEALRSHPALNGADLVFLQELDPAGVDAIAKGLGMNYAYCPSSVHQETKRDIGPAILSPWPMDERRKIRLPHYSRVSKHARSVVTARVSVAGRSLRAYSVHFGTLLGLSPSQRREQLQAVVDDARAIGDPVIVGGDFNAKSLAERLAGQGYTWPTRDIGHTWKIFAFDHILSRGLTSAGTPSAGVAREVKGVSDHYPAWALFAAP